MAESPVDTALAGLLSAYDGSRMTTVELITRVRALAAAGRSEGVDDFARQIQAVLYTPGLSDEDTVNRITEIVDGHLAGVPARSPDAECVSCGEGRPTECASSRRACGHHCNHSWSHESCCWCGNRNALMVLRQIAEGRPNQPFDPWAQSLARDALARSAGNGDEQ